MFELLLESTGAVELAAPETEMLLVGDCADTVLTAAGTKLLLLEAEGELLSVLDADRPDGVLRTELEAAEFVTTDERAELGALESVDEVL